MLEASMILLLVTGLILLLLPEIQEEWYKLRERVIEWMHSLQLPESESNETGTENAVVVSDSGDKLIEYIRSLLKITLSMGSDKSVRLFWILSIICGGMVLLLLTHRISAGLTIAAATAALLLPYGLLRMRLQEIRIQSSREGEILITELTENYKIHYCNMQKAIEVTAMTIEDAPNCKRILFHLSKGLNRAGSSVAIERLLDEFRLSINTSWANILSSNIFFALVSGIHVTEALSDLSEAIAGARKVEEYARRENQESKLMLKYLAPLFYGFTIFGGIKMFGLTADKFLHYQFGTQIGLTWFVGSAILYVSGIFVYHFVSHTKLDF